MPATAPEQRHVLTQKSNTSYDSEVLRRSVVCEDSRQVRLDGLTTIQLAAVESDDMAIRIEQSSDALRISLVPLRQDVGVERPYGPSSAGDVPTDCGPSNLVSMKLHS